VPGRLDQQASSVTVAGLGDRSLAAALAGGTLTGHESQVGADRAPVSLSPGAGLPDEALAQEQLGEPVAGAQQITAGVLAGAHEVTGALLHDARYAHRDEFSEAQQASQLEGVAAVGLHALAGGPQDAAWGGHQAGAARWWRGGGWVNLGHSSSAEAMPIGRMRRGRPTRREGQTRRDGSGGRGG